MTVALSALPVRAGDKDAGAARLVLHAAPVPPVPRPQRLQAAGELPPPSRHRDALRRRQCELRTCFCPLCLQACLLLSLESTYPPAHQLSLDMLKVWNPGAAGRRWRLHAVSLCAPCLSASVHGQRRDRGGPSVQAAGPGGAALPPRRRCVHQRLADREP